MKTSQAGIDIIKKWETLQLKAYKCPRGRWTIGYGHTGDVHEGQEITEHQADAILDLDLDKFEQFVNRIKGLNENQFSALVSFAFNVGTAALYRSALLRFYRAGELQKAAAEFRRWIYCEGKILNGLVVRREEELDLFLLECTTKEDKCPTP